MQSRKKALVFFDQDMTIRHFLLSAAFRELQERYDIVFAFHRDTSTSKKSIHADIDAILDVPWLGVDLPRKRAGQWDLLQVAAIIRYTSGVPDNAQRMALFALGRSQRLMNALRIVGLPGIFELFRVLFRSWMGVHRPLLDMIEREKPDIMLHPTILAGFLINDLVVASENTGIPLVCLMNSWDNPSQKRAAAGTPTKMVVWGEQGRRHAESYFGMPSKDVIVGGAAQLEIYRQYQPVSRSELCREFGVPEDVPVVLYAGCSKGVDETAHLVRLDAAIAAGKIPATHVIYRPHPWRGNLTRGEVDVRSLGLRHVTIDPHMLAYYDRISREHVPDFQLSDYLPIVRLYHLADAVVSPLSTMMLEATLCGKPVLFLCTEDDSWNDAVTMRDMRKLAHFTEFFGVPGVQECYDIDELDARMVALLRDARTPEISQSLKRHAAFFVDLGSESYGQRLAALVDRLVAAGSLHVALQDGTAAAAAEVRQ